MFHHRTRQLLGRIRGRAAPSDAGSTLIADSSIIQTFVANPNNTFLVSFPRTGSHWLRMLMELYFRRPSLVRVFYYPERRDYLTLHTHDVELDVQRSHVIYLYRNPVDTIFSQLWYHKEPVTDRGRITYWSDLYGRHLDKWLYRERFATRKTVLTYEGMKRDLASEFGKVARHFGERLDEARLARAASLLTKDEVLRKTKHDPQVINLTRLYEEERQRFGREHGAFVCQVLLNDRQQLQEHF